MVGIKLEESNRIELRVNTRKLNILEQIGNLEKLEKDNELYRLNIKPQFIVNNTKGAKPKVYEILSKSFQIAGQYRTYDYIKARKSAVFLEPIRVFK